MSKEKSSQLIPQLKKIIFRKQDAEKALRTRYSNFFGRELNTEDVSLFTEKIFLRMILGNRGHYKEFTELSDKHLARKFVAERIGEKHLPKLLWHGKNPHLIPFDDLPSQYIIKTNHGCGGNIIVKSTPNRKDIIENVENWLNENYYWDDYEFQYYGIKPTVVIEELLNDGNLDGPLDYRFWCFDGSPAVIQIDNHSHSINNFYDTTWTRLDLSYREISADCEIQRPQNLAEMIEIASKLSSRFDFIRVDLYNIDGHIYFGELTFTPVAGRLRFKPAHWDQDLGKLWKIRVY